MGYNLEIETRIKKIIANWKNIDTKKMFGGVCHLLKGNMFCGVYKDFLILRIGKNSYEESLKFPFVKPFDITGRSMKGWVMVKSQGFKTDDELTTWLTKAKEYVETLPAK